MMRRVFGKIKNRGEVKCRGWSFLGKVKVGGVKCRGWSFLGKFKVRGSNLL
jgi:hypothetical protein